MYFFLIILFFISFFFSGTIILDTYCFSETVKRYTDLDREIVNQCKILGKIDISEDDLFNQLKESKNDVSQLSAPQLLIKDMKTVYNIPISTLTTLAQVSKSCFCFPQLIKIYLILFRKIVRYIKFKD